MAGLPSFSTVLGDSKLSSASRIMVAGIEYTANLSIKYNRPFQFEADVNANSFQIKDTIPYPTVTSGSIRLNNIPPVNENDIIFNSLSANWYVVDFDTTGNFAGVSIDSGPAALKFYPDGHSTYADSVYVLSFAGQSNTITINGISGRISVD